jgi:hypothetical protein
VIATRLTSPNIDTRLQYRDDASNETSGAATQIGHDGASPR